MWFMSDGSASDLGRYVGLRLEADGVTFLGRRTVGPLAGVRSGLERGRVSAAWLERAIAEVEELIMPLIRDLPAGAELGVSGSELAVVVALVSGGEGGAVPIESVEELFNQLADYAAGSPVAWRHAVPAERVALGLVVLREVMHHGGFRSVSLLPDTA